MGYRDRTFRDLSVYKAVTFGRGDAQLRRLVRHPSGLTRREQSEVTILTRRHARLAQGRGCRRRPPAAASARIPMTSNEASEDTIWMRNESDLIYRSMIIPAGTPHRHWVHPAKESLLQNGDVALERLLKYVTQRTFHALSQRFARVLIGN
jgi:hypothetical protein